MNICVSWRNTLIALKNDSVGCYGSEENEPQIKADERGFVASNPAHLIGSWDLALLLFLSFSLVVASATYRRVGFYGFGLLFFKNRSIKSAFICVHLRLNFSKAEYSIPACAELRRILILFMLFLHITIDHVFFI